MPRQPRIEYPGACYHVMARGDRREPIFEDAKDRERFIETMGEAAERSGWKIYAWVLMDNHYHWAIETPEANLAAGMKWFQNTYTRRINSRHGKWGHLFGGRYKAISVQNEKNSGRGGGEYLCALLDYIHLNPVRAGLVNSKNGLGLLEYPWSSLSQGYAVAERDRELWMAVKEGLALFGFEDRAKDRRHFIERLEDRAEKEASQAGALPLPGQGRQSTLERGWYWGNEEFREKLISLCKTNSASNRNYRSSPIGKEQERRTAEEWIEVGKAHFRLDLPSEGRQHHRERVAIAWALHRRTNQAQKWIAEKLGLHSAANVSQQVRRFQLETDESTKVGTFNKAVSKWISYVKNC